MPRCAIWRAKAHEGTIKQNYMWYCEEHLNEMLEHRAEILADLARRRSEIQRTEVIRGQLRSEPGRSARDGQGAQRSRLPLADGQRGRASGPDRPGPEPLANI